MRTKEKFYTPKQFFMLFDQFILDTSRGKRLMRDGKKIRSGTIENYVYCRNLLQRFLENTNFDLKLYIVTKLRNSEREKAKKYYKEFFREFTDFMYYKLDLYDNYVGNITKCLRTFFNYLNNERGISVGNYHKLFYTPSEDIPIVTLTPEQLQYMIYDEDLNKKLPEHLVRVKDVFVFGCTVALRFSDLMGLTKQNIHFYKNNYYIKTNSIKTNTRTSIKLPEYALEILKKYHDRRQKRILPQLSKAWFNKCLKELASHLEFKEPMIKYRNKRGQKHIVYKNKDTKTHYTLADHITTHTMRRTAISMMLRMDIPEQVVRNISGHAPKSKEFYRYVEFSQNYIDEHTDKAFDKLSKLEKFENIFAKS